MNNLSFSRARVKGYAKEKQFQKNHYDTLGEKRYSKYGSFLPPDSIIFYLLAFLISFHWTKGVSVLFGQEWNLMQQWVFIKLNLQ